MSKKELWLEEGALGLAEECTITDTRSRVVRNCTTDDSSSTSFVVLGCTARNLHNEHRDTCVPHMAAPWYVQDIHTGNEVDVDYIPRVNPQVLLYKREYINHPHNKLN